MECKECNCCHEVPLTRWSATNRSYITEYVYKCFGVKKPFVIEDINIECTEYPNKTVDIENAIEHFKYGISHDIFSEPVTSYAKMAVAALERQIPKKPRIWENKHYFSPTPNDDWGYECPCCGNQEIDYPDHHCDCGQTLNWDDICI